MLVYFASLLPSGKESHPEDGEVRIEEVTELITSDSDKKSKANPSADRRETKKVIRRRPISSAPQPKQDSAVNEFKILRRPPSARQSMAMSVAHIGLPDEHIGKLVIQSNCLSWKMATIMYCTPSYMPAVNQLYIFFFKKVELSLSSFAVRIKFRRSSPGKTSYSRFSRKKIQQD